MLAQRPTLTDEELREISTMQLRNVLAARRAPRQTQENQTRRTLFLVVPLSVVVVCIVILLATCYPSAVFLWGDEVERYASTLQRRKVIWGIIIGVTVVGVSSGFLFEHVASWFRH
jgi:ABC-type Fe3+ transport system permease subunit